MEVSTEIFFTGGSCNTGCLILHYLRQETQAWIVEPSRCLYDIECLFIYTTQSNPMM